METNLLRQVQANAIHQPAWLQKKRALAVMLKNRFKLAPGQQTFMEAWQDPQMLTDSEPSYQLHLANDYVALPLQKAVLQYPELLQENLMEKAVRWQDNQLNAMHLALMDAGQFVYVPDQQKLTQPLQFKLESHSQNPHNLIIVGAGSEVTIEEHSRYLNPEPTYAATEILVGTGATVHYRQEERFRTSQIRHAIHVYQARQAQVDLAVVTPPGQESYSSLYSFLDGNGSQWSLDLAAMAEHGQHLQVDTLVDGYGMDTTANVNEWGWHSADGQIDFGKLATVDDEPLPLTQHSYLGSPNGVRIDGQIDSTMSYASVQDFFDQKRVTNDWLKEQL
ncbi:hypothetical protein FD27_GL001247 [Limosilactobacillus frumenti DSM 13145]|uniref:SUF system FeS cluster assembly SufBD core domain-containing protein n=1 Tax=Limosilactobacillus frumenti DSM 13145 TaxID=1423746 RepID=A0A0R1P5I2_9LACO|nr:SufD family Fe-S cluster assembly protein [Limosilactobacillus frumenti]KRL27484.1 hypothetical protein FD27_GL001247 [Limosilactobacillus frumenti DSM 13145]MBA2913251.1 hypothetical protein [Limosilactobacillus frumenti]QFG72915.1 hypothetical protein LF145_06040 [Limosilactobacillus frumenti]